MSGRQEKEKCAYIIKDNMSATAPYDSGSSGCTAQPIGRYAPVTLTGDVELNPVPASLSVYHCNARSLVKELPRLPALAKALGRHDVVGFTETWLTCRVADCEIQRAFENHTLFRRDRGRRRGGGVLCAVRSSLMPRPLPSPPGVEMLVVLLAKLGVTVAIVYRPPKDKTALRKMIDVLANVPLLIIVGDFNIPEIAWKCAGKAASPIVAIRSSRAKCLLKACSQMGLEQWVSEPTRGKNTLDLVLTRHVQCNNIIVRNSLLTTDHKETIADIEVPDSSMD